MSIPTSLTGLEVNVDRAADKITNKAQIHFTHTGDDNANQLSSLSDEGGLLQDTEYNMTSLPPLVSQSESHDKMMIWGSEQQCSEPGLREIELVECQDINTFLRSPGEEDDDEDDGGSTRDGKDEGPMSISSSSTASSASTGVRRNDNDSNKVESRIQTDTAVRGNITYHSTEELDTCVTGLSKERNTKTGRGGLKQSKSETNVFVSNLSTINLSGSLSSALDCSRDTLICLPNSKTNPYLNTNNTTSAQSLRREAPVDHNTPLLHHQERQEEERIQFRNGSTSEGGLGQRRRTGFEERVLPPRRQQLVRPLCQTEMVRAQSLESGAQGAEIGRSHAHNATTVSPGDTQNGSNRKLARSSLREPSDFSHLYNTCGVFQPRQPNQAMQKEVSLVERQPGPAAQFTSNPSKPSNMEKRPQTQFTYRRNCSSPKRTFTPPHSPLRTPQGSPHRQASMYLISKDTRRGVQNSPAVKTTAQGNESVSVPVKTNITLTGIPKVTLNQQSNPNSSHNSSPKESSPSLKPKGVRPKIITYVRKNPQFKPQASDGPYQVSSLPARLSAYPHGATPGSFKDTPKYPSKLDKETRGLPVLSASNLLYDKYRKEIQTSFCPSGLMNRSIHAPNTVPPAHTHSYTAPPKLGRKAGDSYGAQTEVGRSANFKETSEEDPLQLRTAAQAGGSGSLLRSGRGLRLGLGAVTRTASGSGKGKGPGQSQRSAIIQAIQPVISAASQKSQDTTADDEVFNHHPPAPEAPASEQAQAVTSSRSLLPKAANQSGLRPPGFSSTRLPVGRLAAFGFVRSSSVSSVSSVHSADSVQSDPSRTAHRLSVSEEPSRSPSSTDHQRSVPCRSNSLQPPSTPALPRRYLPAQPRSSPGVGRKEFQRSSEVTRSLPSSPKRLAVVPPKPQSPVQSGQRPAGGLTTRLAGPPGSPRRVSPLKLQQEKEDAHQRDESRKAEEREKEEQRQEMERLRGRCEEQERHLRALREELRKTSLGLEVFIVTTQHYCLKNQTAEDNETKLFLEIQMIKKQLVSNSTHWERLKLEKSAVEAAFQRELQELQVQQEVELAAVEESLRKCHSAETESLKAEHQSEMEELRTQQQEQVEEMTAHHQAAIQELRDMHNITMATLHEEHARTMRDLRKAHEQQKMLLEEDFEKLRLSLQDQVDTLTFQNHSLQDKAKRFEEALKKSTDEQIVDALAPYQHIDKDLKSLKEVVEMKNQQIHQQDLKISDLQKVAQKNVFLEERVQVLQQQNEDLKARIDMNLALSRQLSEENANLQESVEKESTEKKRLSRNNEELLWRLQTSPLMSPSSSPLHRSFSTSPIPSSPLLSSSPVPSVGCHSPAHCQGCPQQLQSSSPFHTANHYYSPGPATPTHQVATNQNYSPGPATPNHRAAATNQNYSPGPCTPTHRETANRNSAACLALQR
ncbi:microtubule-associated tumor suppressor candidate 2 homolog isoform X2 [Dunckerocampus dactyliophorus]|uniref:microtubule-associated tumor suppressor candidate 2 homolog isoform X2 n=1 Tax=Dunckerocampus dactyliophorus TaxID=161453 RepID=UPI0024068C82|nr:microtubule-associated tumor suppressor candidate 2 homolog isoform X2 [Dunckerocampus dactyliophorus]